MRWVESLNDPLPGERRNPTRVSPEVVADEMAAFRQLASLGI